MPPSVQARLQTLLDRQDEGAPLTTSERQEAEGLVNLAEMLAKKDPELAKAYELEPGSS